MYIANVIIIYIKNGRNNLITYTYICILSYPLCENCIFVDSDITQPTSCPTNFGIGNDPHFLLPLLNRDRLCFSIATRGT